MKSFIMTSGEMEYEQVFRFRDFEDSADGTSTTAGDINYITMSHVLFIIFVILMPVLFANLLVSTGSSKLVTKLYPLSIQIGLAVGDTQKVEEKATLTYLSLQVMCSYMIVTK